MLMTKLRRIHTEEDQTTVQKELWITLRTGVVERGLNAVLQSTRL